MIVAITYGDDNFSQSTAYNLWSAKKYGKVDGVMGFSPLDIEDEFKIQNKEIFSVKKGAGYWIWKPYIIKKALERIEENDFLVYSDSGTFYMNDLHLIVGKMRDTDVYLSNVDFLEGAYSKRDAFVYMNADDSDFHKSKQIEAAFFAIRKTKKTVDLINEWLNYCCDIRIISDEDNMCGLPNYEGFVENRYDQTVFSLTCKKHGYKSFGNVSRSNPYFTCIEPLSILGRGMYKEYYKTKSAKKELLNVWENSEYMKPIIVRTRFRNMNPIIFRIKILIKKAKYGYRNQLSYKLTQKYVEYIGRKLERA